MNFTLQSPEGEGQKFTTRFNEPITLPPGAKVSMNFAAFERTGHFHYKEPQRITFFNNHFVDKSGNVSVQSYERTGTLFPRQSMLTTGANGLPDNVSSSISIPKVPNTNTEIIQEDNSFIIPAGSYTMRGIQKEIQKQFYAKEYFGPENDPDSIQNFFGTKSDGTIDLPDVKPYGDAAFMYNKQYIPVSLIEDKITLGAVKVDGLGNHNQIYNQDGLPTDKGIMNVSSVHQKNATFTINASIGFNDYKASAANASGNFNDANASYILSRNRMIHLDSDRAFQDRLPFFNNPQVGIFDHMLDDFEGEYVRGNYNGYAMKAATINKYGAGNTWSGKDFIVTSVSRQVGKLKCEFREI